MKFILNSCTELFQDMYFTEDKPWLEDKQFSYGALAKTKPKQTNQIQFLLTLMN